MKRNKSNLVEAEKNREDSGFGSKVVSTDTRLVKTNGDFNVKKIGQSFSARSNIFHRTISMPIWKLIFLIFLFYFFTNLIFGSLYYLNGIDFLQGIDTTHGLGNFWEAFFFSSQTLTTLGYGRVSPIGLFANTLASFEALIGLLIFSVLTSILYGRFSKPVPKILYSSNALIGPYLDIRGLMIRTANEKSNQLINVEASIIYSCNVLKNGEIRREYFPLTLERAKVKYFSLSWTLVHPITEESPLFNETEESLKASNAEFMVSLEGINDTFYDPVHSRKSYLFNEVKWGEKFVSIIGTDDHQYVLDLANIDKSEKV